MGDARPVRGRRPRAHGRARVVWHLRRLAHGRDRSRRPAGARAAAEAAVERRRKDHARPARGRGAVQPALPRGRRRARRRLHLSPRRRSLPDRHQRRQSCERPRLVPNARGGLSRGSGERPDRRLRDARRAGTAGARHRPGDLRRSAARAHDRRDPAPGRRRGAGLRHRLHRRGRRRAALPACRCDCAVGRDRRTRRRAGGPSPPATRCAWRCAFTCTATT